MFEDSYIYKFIKNSGFPLINRNNREIYNNSQYQLDPAQIYRRTFYTSVIGYIIGRRLGGKQVIFAIGFGACVLFYHLSIDILLKSKGKYQQIYRPPLFTLPQHSRDLNSQNIKENKLSDTVMEQNKTSMFRMKPILLNSQYKQIEKLVKSLPNEYFV